GDLLADRGMDVTLVEDRSRHGCSLRCPPVAFERGGIRAGIGEPDMAVGPDEVERVSREAGAARGLAPGERVQRDPELAARLDQIGARLAVNVRLPVEGSERGEVVG